MIPLVKTIPSSPDGLHSLMRMVVIVIVAVANEFQPNSVKRSSTTEGKSLASSDNNSLSRQWQSFQDIQNLIFDLCFFTPKIINKNSRLMKMNIPFIYPMHAPLQKPIFHEMSCSSVYHTEH